MRRKLLEIFYSVLNANIKVLVGTIISVSLMILWWNQATEILDHTTKTNWGWNTQEVDRSNGTYIVGASNEKWALDKIVAQEVACLRTDIVLLTKWFLVAEEKKVNTVDAWGKASRHEDLDTEEKAKYLDRGGGLLNQGSNKDNCNSK